jgi:membrane dipeptidase
MNYVTVAVLVAMFAWSGEAQVKSSSGNTNLDRAKRLIKKYGIIDTHIDAPERAGEVANEDISVASKADFDYVKAKAGGLTCGFMSIYVPSSYQKSGGARELAERLITMVEGWTTRWPDKFVRVNSVADVRNQRATGKIAMAMGMENGAGLEQDLTNVSYFFKKGIRYITLTHAEDNLICDSSFDTTRTWHGLSPFGAKVVAEMNRVGVMVDISHVSDSAFYQVMRITKAPVIASHSSCRFFVPDLERNMSDDMIKVLAANNGVIQINFGAFFISGEYRATTRRRATQIAELLKARGLTESDSAGKALARKYREENPVAMPSVVDVANHIDHVVKLVGVDHVGIGSDYDGVGDNLPVGLKDASTYPNLIAELLKRGYSEDDIRKICSDNLLRVWSEVETIAHQLQK